ncbi:serine/threonine-protein kinase B-raf [Arabidopsis lyrata subsp. lyrata]|uniref:serine/threonine-protein kinase B-raf n=1 Tax=Arabidopsis lyrata subsp. lyrata TaxID=81972 RepID=UPI000A29A35A|nr:serine/threonine-protein kinase B-raf [Arabidopsis lyrata subsp. lyrata]|eukprot:XP_020884091.1 serine/threonine-protein kinase B-raf [Arabidopsis lyrata subsp. lyrata]
MGANCCKCCQGSVESVHNSTALTLADIEVQATADLEVQATDLREVTVEETRDVAGPSEPNPPSPTLRPSQVEEISKSVCVGETSNTKESPKNLVQDRLSSYEASNILWSTGFFSDPIPSGFYSVIPVDRLQLFKSIPTMEVINALGKERFKADAICVDLKNDIQLVMIMEFFIKSVKGKDSKEVIKKTAVMVADVYRIKTPLQSPARTVRSFQIHGFPLLGKIKHGSCRARAILFKVLADAVGLESKLVVGFPSDLRSSASVDSCNHMSVVVEHNNVEMLVDLKRCPGQLTPFSPKAVYMAHISTAWQTDFVDNDSCVSPLEPNSPMERSCPPSVLQSGLSRSLSAPNIATEFFWRKVIKEQPPADFSCNSDGGAESESKRIRRRRMKTPDLNADVSRAVELMMQRDFLKERGDDDSSPCSPDDVSSFQLDSHDQVSGERSTLNRQKAISFPSSPRSYQIQPSERSEPSRKKISQIWNEVLESPMFQNNPLLPYEQWNINFSDLTVGAFVGSGSSGVVCRGIWNKTEVAIKMLFGQQLTAENMKDFCNEISILSRLRHPNVILFLGACTKPPQLSMITEYMNRGSLYDILRTRKKGLSWERKLKILSDICRGLMGIHQMGIVHRDLKSANCLLNKGIVKICDFGLSRMKNGTTVEDTEAAGTPEWMAPELIRNEPVTEKCDIFSFGVIMWELCTLSQPWKGVPKEKVIHIVANEGARLTLPEGPLRQLIADCWLEPEQRPSCKEIMHRLKTCKFPIC